MWMLVLWGMGKWASPPRRCLSAAFLKLRPTLLQNGGHALFVSRFGPVCYNIIQIQQDCDVWLANLAP